jgi:hypothetical protein
MDVLHDATHKLWVNFALSPSSSIPEYVYNYTLPEVKAASTFENSEFADPVRRWFPIGDASTTWLSALYFNKHALADELPYKKAEREFVGATILKAGKLHGIESDLKQLIDGLADTLAANKQAAANVDDDAAYGIVLRHATTGQVLDRKYPLFDTVGVRKAADYFTENRSRYPAEWRKTIATNILRKAAEFGMGIDTLPAPVKREAGYGLPRKDVVMNELLERAHLIKDAANDDVAVLLANINELVAVMDNKEFGENLDKIAEIIDAFDKVANLTSQYDRKILMPADFLYDLDMKAAADAVENAVELNNHVFYLSKLAELDVAVYGVVLGPDFVQAIIKQGTQKIDADKLSDNLSSLPKPDKVALEDYLVDHFG